MLGGRVGIADHVTLGEGVSLAASAGLFRDVAAGETWEMEIAICADTTLEPELTWTLDGQVGFRYDSWVTVETPTSESTTTVSSFGSSEPLPSCEAVVDPIDVMVVEVALP